MTSFKDDMIEDLRDTATGKGEGEIQLTCSQMCSQDVAVDGLAAFHPHGSG